MVGIGGKSFSINHTTRPQGRIWVEKRQDALLNILKEIKQLHIMGEFYSSGPPLQTLFGPLSPLSPHCPAPIVFKQQIIGIGVKTCVFWFNMFVMCWLRPAAPRCALPPQWAGRWINNGVRRLFPGYKICIMDPFRPNHRECRLEGPQESFTGRSICRRRF